MTKDTRRLKALARRFDRETAERAAREDRAELLALHTAGFTYNELAEALDRSYPRIAQLLRQAREESVDSVV